MLKDIVEAHPLGQHRLHLGFDDGIEPRNGVRSRITQFNKEQLRCVFCIVRR